jgi:hypothetical protein
VLSEIRPTGRLRAGTFLAALASGRLADVKAAVGIA